MACRLFWIWSRNVDAVTWFANEVFPRIATVVVLVILGPTVWVDVLGNEAAIFPYKYPALFSMSVAFLGIWFFSVSDRSEAAKREAEAFEAQYIRSQTGLGAEGATEPRA